MSSIRTIPLLIMALFAAAACGGNDLTQAEQNELREKAQKEVERNVDAWLTNLGQQVPTGQCEGATLCTSKTGEAVVCPNGCTDSCEEGGCPKPSWERHFHISVTVSTIAYGEVQASATIKASITTTANSRRKHNHSTEAPTQMKDPGEWVNWKMVFDVAASIEGKVSVKVKAATIELEVDIGESRTSIERCSFTSCGQECGPKPTCTKTGTTQTNGRAAFCVEAPEPLPQPQPQPEPGDPVPVPTIEALDPHEHDHAPH